MKKRDFVGLIAEWNIKFLCDKMKIMKKNLAYVLCYIFWAITVASTFLLLLAGREFYLKIMAFVIKSGWVGGAIDKFLFVGAGILWLAVVIYIEAYYREGVKKDDLVKRFLFVTGIEILILFIFHTIPLAIAGVGFTPVEGMIAIGELGVAIALLFVTRRRKIA
ncbi:MAG TPA: hypothetical protein PK844_02360 [Candidatus Atribacteria bacterium]|nr:hypothetical protein [Candidatus Atribacteria bacterium]HPZ81541.1 hypothetical protein [Candidatus Atribacteria bacterium]HQE24902.1 hypothetical protein [Candidatus Atribacteria bacterium]